MAFRHCREGVCNCRVPTRVKPHYRMVNGRRVRVRGHRRKPGRR